MISNYHKTELAKSKIFATITREHNIMLECSCVFRRQKLSKKILSLYAKIFSAKLPFRIQEAKNFFIEKEKNAPTRAFHVFLQNRINFENNMKKKFDNKLTNFFSCKLLKFSQQLKKS